jgi:CelD/BcsL family acetyltransferase involved in cellulose biosynthesis
LAQSDEFVIFELEIENEVVASRAAFVFGSQIYFYYSGFDPSWSKESVMTTLMCEMFKWAIARGMRLANLSTFKDPSKTRWNPAECGSKNVALMSPTLRGKIAMLAFNCLARRST